ncbi:ATP-binding protein [Mycobacterium kubicae]|uniref:ATP-binding protein n=1 Tax=Mycobacterium kubicae TaxID=120959 RepID=UPI0007FDD071|nr:ATP-binding protein [Mycobacterium kubicae]OBF19168.1 anti-sigma regulatory factor [Mycobacterium kubicae]OBK46558.1 anti-sigma regulatory factor [Mycobacterium kubicae]QNI05051.1 ATP-binding protein [Mycobacterium kubicae]
MTSHIDDRTRFVRMRVAADAHSATQARVEFRSWLDRHFTLGAERFSDLLLAVSEALANAAEFAYVEHAQRGTMDFSADYHAESDTLIVMITDRGCWRPSVPETTPDRQFQIRGRGIPLMRALADEAIIDRTPQGTHVTLRWTHLTGSRTTA